MLGRKWWLLISLAGLLVLVVVYWPSGKSRVIFCDVGQGNGTLVMKNNFQMLIDVGPENHKMVSCLSKNMPFWDKTIEAVIISHMDNDHSGGLDQIRQYYNVQNIYTEDLKAGDVLRYQDISFEILSSGGSDDQNDNSVVGLLKVGDKKLLLMGDAGSEVEQRLVWRDILVDEVDVLMVSHHGSAVATSQELLRVAMPKVAVISVGVDNRFGHPTKIVLERIEKMGIDIRRTDVEGDIRYW